MKKVENIVANGEIARFEQFLLLPQCFQKSSAADVSKCIFKWEWVKLTAINFMHLHTEFNSSAADNICKHCGKRNKNAHNEQNDFSIVVCYGCFNMWERVTINNSYLQ